MSSCWDDKARSSEAQPPGWARSKALELVGGDENLLDEVVAIFLVESPELVTKIQHALLDRDPRMLEHAAHSLKGQLGYLGLSEVSEAQKLEDAGRTGELRGAEGLLAGLQVRLVEVWSTLSRKPGI
jgi:HPt (histidine-containing phosphotransfer) domain-containing protein